MRLPGSFTAAEAEGRPTSGFWGGWARSSPPIPGARLPAACAPAAADRPVLLAELGQEDIGATPKSTTERQAYDLMAAGFGPGYNGPLLVAVKLPSPPKPSNEFTSQ